MINNVMISTNELLLLTHFGQWHASKSVEIFCGRPFAVSTGVESNIHKSVGGWRCCRRTSPTNTRMSGCVHDTLLYVLFMRECCFFFLYSTCRVPAQCHPITRFVCCFAVQEDVEPGTDSPVRDESFWESGVWVHLQHFPRWVSFSGFCIIRFFFSFFFFSINSDKHPSSTYWQVTYCGWCSTQKRHRIANACFALSSFSHKSTTFFYFLFKQLIVFSWWIL